MTMDKVEVLDAQITKEDGLYRCKNCSFMDGEDFEATTPEGIRTHARSHFPTDKKPDFFNHPVKEVFDSEVEEHGLQQKYPLPYGHLRYGFEVPAGWMGLLDELGERLQNFLGGTGYTPPESPVIVKEKFARLEVQGLSPPEEVQSEVYSAISDARAQSKNTCYVCGSQDGERVHHGSYVSVKCPMHQDS